MSWCIEERKPLCGRLKAIHRNIHSDATVARSVRPKITQAQSLPASLFPGFI